MTRTLILDSAVTGEASVSKRLTAAFADELRRRDPKVQIVSRDLGANPVPHLLPETVAGIRATATTEAEKAALALSDELVDELRETDLLVIGAPMYNFGIPSALKTWFDYILRAGVTFRYTENGPEGLLPVKKAVVIETRGGLYSEGPAVAMDSQEPHLRTLLGFMGVNDVIFVRAEKLGFGPEAVQEAVDGAIAELNGCAEKELALAA
ncbi:FMN-dependent NADH-azoreductase [Sphingosinicella humi]|uniref:FMN dependent NADH:quinone oxidoreductase n=1 Tax=Allosphingosinicella humi TaxID=2068657 RepID=A0A2U2J439_9SPHN|nr:FMN-dependent NADH-azoreductase [Sphingosinicella humi]PWG03082.1 FMN-dependent NADH-azoreductase [Sphingosinicella humi]